jgi:hypothetical protein
MKVMIYALSVLILTRQKSVESEGTKFEEIHQAQAIKCRARIEGSCLTPFHLSDGSDIAR